MADWDEHEANARRVLPMQEIKPKRCWIGVLSHEKTLGEKMEEADFLWMIGHNAMTLQTIYDTYLKRHEGVDFELRFKGNLVSLGDTIKKFIKPNDTVVFFEACLKRSFPAQVSLVTMHRPAAARGMTNASPLVTGRVKQEPQEDRPSLALASENAASNSPLRSSIQQGRIPGSLVSPEAQPESSTRSVPQSPGTRAYWEDSTPHNNGHSTTIGTLNTPSKRLSKEAEIIPDQVHHYMEEEEAQTPFDPDAYFAREPTPEQASQDVRAFSDQAVRKIIAQQNPDLLEAGVAQAIHVLQRLSQIFLEHAEIPDACAWRDAIEKLIPQAERRRTIVGVVGNTGAGKSSVINAMLDEERLVPTNCMRACTAVVTEMSWNPSTEVSNKYCAEIEFVSRQEWEKEVATLIKEFLTEGGSLSREISDENSDAGIAWAKFHSVYPKKTRDSLGDCTVESLMSEQSVLAVLGTTKKINSAYPDSFYRQLQKYVDSKEKVSKNGKDKEKQKKITDMEYWPLIKVVKIYVKAKALSTGAVIVDLPGVHDSNAARAAVAQGYIKQCTGLWIVAPITRAVDDKAAKNLLGESFKRQLKYDGGFSSVTFICSKTDDISITEAIDSLELDDEVGELHNQEQSLEREIETTNNKIVELQESREVYQAAGSSATQDMEDWEELLEKLKEGKVVFAPKARSTKRKKLQPKQHAKKRQRSRNNDSDEDFIVSDEEDTQSELDDSSDEDIRAPQIPLTEDIIKAKLKELRESRKNARRTSVELLENIKTLKAEVARHKNKIAAIKADIRHICIAGRNDYSKRAIQKDFAAGIRELDQEHAAEEDEDNFNPDEDIRDYEEVAKSLPVFCVSSRAYQQLSGRLRKDDSVPGFKTVIETEIPQLQAHCQKLTENGRIQTARTFLLNLCQQLTTFSLWASDDGTGLKMTDDDKRKQIKFIEKRLGDLEMGLEDSVRACLNVMKKEMNDQIFDRYPALITEAIQAAPETASKWGAHKSDGGLYWGTYKAIVRRDGRYHSATAGHRDFNAELVDPIVKKLATGWERAFQQKLPNAFDKFTKDSGKLLHKFHENIEQRARSNGVGLANLAALKTQIVTYEQMFRDLNQILITKMTELQREANRDFTPTIANIMHAAYERCADEHGTGSFKRMKDHMSAYIDQYRQTMFNDATYTVKRHLDSLCKELEKVMEDKSDEIYVMMKMDYTRVLGGVNVAPTALLSKAERALRAAVKDVLGSIDEQFGPIARGQMEQAAAVMDAQAQAPAEESIFVDEDDEGDNDSVVGGGEDDAMLMEPAPKKARLRIEDTTEKENHALLTPSDDDMYAKEV
ncbi:hypothetical protein ACEQ8H_000556 [Pleosporales sp. CAS-2024a]